MPFAWSLHVCLWRKWKRNYLGSRLRLTWMGPRFDALLSISAKTRLAVIEVGGLGLAPLMHPSKIAAHFFAFGGGSGGGNDRRFFRRWPFIEETIYRLPDRLWFNSVCGASRFIFQGAAAARFVLFNRRSGVREISKRELRLVNKIIRPKTETLCKWVANNLEHQRYAEKSKQPNVCHLNVNKRPNCQNFYLA
jgi:hypothetical protein